MIRHIYRHERHWLIGKLCAVSICLTSSAITIAISFGTDPIFLMPICIIPSVLYFAAPRDTLRAARSSTLYLLALLNLAVPLLLLLLGR